MKKRLPLLFLFTLLTVFAVSGCDQDTSTNIGAKDETDINFIMINDTHGAFTDSDAGYSIGRVDSLVETLEAANGDYIFIHNGDAFQGSYVSGETYGLAMVEALNCSGVDCFVLGNHEFDWGIDKIAAYADGDEANGEASFPFLGANIYYKGTDTRPDWIDAYAVLEQDGVRVGVIGVIGEYQESDILTRHVRNYDFVDPIGIIRTTSAYLRGVEDCDVVVVAMHDYSRSVNSEIAELDGLNRIDAIFCAHTHQKVSESVTRSDSVEIPVVQCNHKNNNVQEVTITLTSDRELDSYEVNLHKPADYSISYDVQMVIAKYQHLIDESNQSIGTANEYLSKQTLGKYAVEAMLNYEYSLNAFESIDVAIMNTGGIRATIGYGAITRAEVFEVFPFNNAVVLVNISGKLLKEMCDNNSEYLYIDVADSIGHYSLLDNDTVYQLAVIDYVFEGPYYRQFDNLNKNDYVITECILRDIVMLYLDEIY